MTLTSWELLFALFMLFVFSLFFLFFYGVLLECEQSFVCHPNFFFLIYTSIGIITGYQSFHLLFVPFSYKMKLQSLDFRQYFTKIALQKIIIFWFTLKVSEYRYYISYYEHSEQLSLCNSKKFKKKKWH